MSISRFPWKHALGGNHTHADVPFQQQRVTTRSLRALLCSILELRMYSVTLNVIKFDLWSVHPSYLARQESHSGRISKSVGLCERFWSCRDFSLTRKRQPGKTQRVENPLPSTGLPHHPDMTGVNKQAPHSIYTFPNDIQRPGIYTSTNTWRPWLPLQYLRPWLENKLQPQETVWMERSEL